jgi:hypothetical protein
MLVYEYVVFMTEMCLSDPLKATKGRKPYLVRRPHRKIAYGIQLLFRFATQILAPGGRASVPFQINSSYEVICLSIERLNVACGGRHLFALVGGERTSVASA